MTDSRSAIRRTRSAARGDPASGAAHAVHESIEWCRRHYRRTPVPLTLRHADVHNTLYNPGGRIRAADYRFPYPDASFDLVFAISLFTHLVPENAEHYLKEAARVIAPGGRMFLTWFVLTDAPAPSPSLDFHASLGEAKVINPQNLEAAIAFPESWVRDRLATNGLVLWEPIQLGYWRGSRSICYQDIVVAQRT